MFFYSVEQWERQAFSLSFTFSHLWPQVLSIPSYLPSQLLSLKMSRAKKDFTDRAKQAGGDVLPPSVYRDRNLNILGPRTLRKYEQKLE
jgi:hypothetical protein